MAASSSQTAPSSSSSNFEHADLVSGSRHARKSFGEGEAGPGPANLFLTLASSAAPKFQSQETSREHSGDTRQPLRHPGDLRGSRICRRGRIDELRMYIVKSACISAEYYAARHRSDRVNHCNSSISFVAVHESVHGTKRTWEDVCRLVRFRGQSGRRLTTARVSAYDPNRRDHRSRSAAWRTAPDDLEFCGAPRLDRRQEN